MSYLKQRTTVEIWGEEYTIKSDISPEQVQEIANYVNMKMQMIKQKAENISFIKLAVLACLNISEELFAVRRQLEETQNLMEDETTKILRLLDDSLYSSMP